MTQTPPKSSVPEKLPPPSFSLLVATFSSQALLALGQLPNPIDGKTQVHLDLARHAIDMLQIIEEKTKGNLTPDEAGMLEAVLHQLRLAYVEASTKKTGE